MPWLNAILLDAMLAIVTRFDLGLGESDIERLDEIEQTGKLWRIDPKLLLFELYPTCLVAGGVAHCAKCDVLLTGRGDNGQFGEWWCE